MKKIFFYSLLLAAFVACDTIEVELPPSDNGADSVPGMITEIVSGSRESFTKATIDANAAFAWTVGDNIAVHVSDNENNNHKYVFTSGDGGASQAASSASFKVTYDSGYSRDAFAVFPSTIVSECTTAEDNYGQSDAQGDHTLDVTLPSTYTLAQVSGENGVTSPCPMIATNAVGSGWEFYQLCSLLRLTVNSIPPSAKRLEIDFHGKKIWGDFSISNPNPGISSLETSTDDAHDVITITKDGKSDVTLNNNAWKDGLVLNIPLPIGTYTNITVTAYNKLEGGDAILTIVRPFAYIASLEKGVKKTASFHVFSITTRFGAPSFATQTRRVIFAPGNLQATTSDNGTTWTWGFAAHQYDYIGNNAANTKINGNKTVSQNGNVDLFGWSTTSNYFGISNSTNGADYSGDFVDWGTIHVFNGIDYPSTYWKTMTSGGDTNPYSEWWSVLRSRLTGATINGVSNARFTEATINTDDNPVNGVIIFPDYYTGPTANINENGISITWGNKINNVGKDANWPDWGGTSCNKAGWNLLESEGCVFLPAAGFRSGTTISWSWNMYASSTPIYSEQFYPMEFKSASNTYTLYSNSEEYKYYGSAVRLVHEVN